MPFTLREAIDCVKNEGLCAELDEAFLQQLEEGSFSPDDMEQECDAQSFFWILYGYYANSPSRRKQDKWLTYDHRFLNDCDDPVGEMSDCVGGDPLYKQEEWNEMAVTLVRFDGETVTVECQSINDLFHLFNTELARREDDRRFYELCTESDFTAHCLLKEEGFIRLSRVLPFLGQKIEPPSAARQKRQMEKQIESIDVKQFGYEKRAAMYEELGRLEEALSDYRSALTAFASRGDKTVLTNRTRLLGKISLVLKKLDRKEEVLSVCDEIISVTAGDRLASNTRGRDAHWMKHEIYAERGDSQKAAAAMSAIEALDNQVVSTPQQKSDDGGFIGKLKKLFGK